MIGLLKKWGIVICVAFIVLGIFTVKTYGVAEKITTDMLQDPNSEKNKENISRIVLEDTGRNAVFSPEETVEITIYQGDLLGNGQEQAVIALSFGLKNTDLAVYTKDKEGDGYTYVSDVGEFFDVKDVFFLPLSSDGTNIMIVREYANQNIGAYERSSFLKGYIWDDKNETFQNVLNIPEGIEVTWNGSWDTSGEERWQKIEERSEFADGKTDNNNPTLNLTQYQAYRISDSTDKDNIPDESTFHTAKNRVVNQTYYWDDNWRRFILSEKKGLTYTNAATTVAQAIANIKSFDVDAPQKVQYVKIVADRTNGNWFTARAFNLYQDITKNPHPTAGIGYDTTEPTNKDVVARLINPSTNIRITNNNGSDTYVFTENGEFTFEFIDDETGLTGTAKAKVNWIDKVAPTATIEYSITTETNNEVIATLIPSEKVTVLNNGEEATDENESDTVLNPYTYTFSKNGEFTFKFKVFCKYWQNTMKNCKVVI